MASGRSGSGKAMGGVSTRGTGRWRSVTLALTALAAPAWADPTPNAQAIPEPTLVALIGLGLACLALFRRKR